MTDVTSAGPGIVNFETAPTGASLEIVRQIDPPANWFGVSEAEGFAAGQVVDIAFPVGEANAVGFAARIENEITIRLDDKWDADKNSWNAETTIRWNFEHFGIP